MALHTLYRVENEGRGPGAFAEVLADYNTSTLRIGKLVGRVAGGPWSFLIVADDQQWRVENVIGPMPPSAPLEHSQNVTGEKWAFTRDEEGALISPISASIYGPPSDLFL